MNECPGVALQTGSVPASLLWRRCMWKKCKCSEALPACRDSRQSCKSEAASLSPQTCGKGYRGKQKFSCTDTFACTLLRRCRSMGKQDNGLCMPWSDSFKGHVSSVHSHQQVTFNGAPADKRVASNFVSTFHFWPNKALFCSPLLCLRFFVLWLTLTTNKRMHSPSLLFILCHLAAVSCLTGKGMLPNIFPSVIVPQRMINLFDLKILEDWSSSSPTQLTTWQQRCWFAAGEAIFFP